MIEKANLSPGRGFQLKRALLYYAQRAAAPVAREAGARALASVIRLKHPPCADADGRARAVARELEAEGCSDLGQLLTPAQVADAVSWLAKRRVHDLAHTERTYDANAVPPEVGIACFSVSDILACPHLLELMNRPSILGAVSAYLGCAPTIAAITLRWSYPHATRAVNVQRFHRDPDDWRFVKLFVYLTEVDEAAGPHVFITRTHKERGSARATLLDDAQAMERYGARIHAQTGDPGSGFLADTFGWHKGGVPRTRARLMLSVQYSILPVYLFLPRPVSRTTLAPCGNGYDAWVNRLIMR